MFTKIIQSVLMKHVGKYLNEVEENSFDVGLIDGDILIQNVGLNNKLFEQLNLPIVLKFSNIDRLSIKVPWTRLDKEPSVVQLTGLNVLITMEESATNNESTALAYKFNRVISWIREELKKDKQGQKKEKELNLEDDSFATKMLLRIIDNIVVEVSNIHVRFEDNSSFEQQSFSLGLLMDRITASTTDPDGNSQFYHRTFNKKKRNERMIKSVLVSPVKVYWNHEETWFIKDAINQGATKNEVIWLMRAPFPSAREQSFSPSSGVSKKGSIGNEPVMSSKDLDSDTKKEKKEKPNAFLQLFKPRDSKKKEKDEKPKESPTKNDQKLPAKLETPEKAKLPPYSEWRMQFPTIAMIAMSATVEMNDLKDKDTPLLNIEVDLQSLQVSSNQIVLGQLFCLLQHFLKYATDIYFYENRSNINNSTLEAANRERFHAAITAILKKNHKTKKFEDLSLDHFGGSQELRQRFFEVLEGYSIRKLESFAEAFMFEWRMKKEIQKAREGHSHSKEKSAKDLQKIMEKIKSNEKEDKDEQLVINTARALFDLRIQLKEAVAVVDYIQQKQRVDSLSLSLKGFFTQLRFVAEDDLDLMVKLQDIVLSYTNRSGQTIFLNKNVMNKEETLVSLLYSQKKQQYSITGELQRKALVLSDEIVGFVLHFFERLRINVFMLNLLVEKAEFSIDRFNLLVKMLLDSLKEIKCDLRIFLPVVELHISPFYLVVEPGVISINMSGNESIQLTLSSVFLRLRHFDCQYRLIDDGALKATLKRHPIEPPKYEDIIQLSMERLMLNAPPISVVDLLALEVLRFAGKVTASTSNLVVTKRQLLAKKVHYNNHLQEFEVHLHGHMLEFTSANGHCYSTSVFRARAYPLVHDGRHYLVLVKKGSIEYLQVADPQALTAGRLNSLIEKMSTCEQLAVFWQEVSKYEQALEANALHHNHRNLLHFIQTTQREARSRTFKLYEVRFLLAALHFDMPQLSLSLKRVQLKSVHHEHNQQLQLKVGRFLASVQKINVVELVPDQHADDFLELHYEKVVAEQCSARLGTADINLTAKLMAPVLRFVADIMSMRIIKADREQTKILPPAQFTSQRLFSLREVEFKARIGRIAFSFFTATSTVEEVTLEAAQHTSHSSLQLSVRGTDILDFVRIPSCTLQLKVSQIEGSILSVLLESLIVEMNPTLFDKYLSIMRQTADGVLMNLQVLHEIQVEALSAIEFSKLLRDGTQSEVVLRAQNAQIQVVLNQQNALALCFDEAQLEAQQRGQQTRLALSVMRLHLQRIHDSSTGQPLQSTIVRPFSVTAKGWLSQAEVRNAQLAVTKIDVEFNFQLLEFFLLVVQRYIVIYGRNPWLGGFLKKFLQQQQFVLGDSGRLRMTDVNTQFDEVTLMYLRDGGAPFLKLLVKSSDRSFELSEQHFDGRMKIEFQLGHFNWRCKMFEPLLERSLAELVGRKYLGKGVNSIEASVKTVRINVSRDFAVDALKLLERVQQYLETHRSRFLEVGFYLEQIAASDSHLQPITEETASAQTKKHRNLVENIQLSHLVVADSVPRKKHTKNYIKLCNKLGVDVQCSLDHVYTEEQRPPVQIATGSSHLMPLSVECEYSENYQVLERLRKMRMQLRVAGRLVFKKDFNLATFLAQTVDIPASDEIKLPISLNVNSQIVDDEYIIQFTTAKRVENHTELDFELVFRSQHGSDYRAPLPRNSSVFMPYFTTSSFCISVAGSRQLFLLNFSKSEQPQEIKLPGPNGEVHCLIIFSEIRDALFTMTLEPGLEVHNHLPVYTNLRINDGELLLEPNKAVRTTLVSLHEGPQRLTLVVPMQTKPGTTEVTDCEKLFKQRQIICQLIEQTVEISLLVLLTGPPINRLLHVYPRLAFINETPQKLFVFCSAYGALFPVQKVLKDNTEDYEKLSFHETVEPAVRCRIKPVRTCYILDSERYLHLGLRNGKKGLSEEFVAYESDFRKTVSAQDDNLVYKYCVRYEETVLKEEVSTFKARLLPKFYLINRTQFVVHLLSDCRVSPNEMVVLPFNKDGLLMMDLENKDGRLHQLAPAHLFEKGQISYDTKNLGFMSSSQVEEGRTTYDESMLVKLELQLIFNNFLGYYILNKRTDKLLVQNHLKHHTLRFQDSNSDSFRVCSELKPGEQKHLFPVFSQQLLVSVLSNEPGEDGPLLSRSIDVAQLASIQHEAFEVREHFQNNLRVVTFTTDQEQSEEEELDQQNIRSIMKATVEAVEMSVIFQDFNLKRKEILNLHLDRLSLTVLDYQQIGIMEAKLGQLIVRSNQTQASPILLKRQQQKEAVTETPFAELFMQVNPSRHLIENFRLVLAPISVYLSDEIIELTMRNIYSLVPAMAPQSAESSTLARGEASDSFSEFYKLYNKKKKKLLEKGQYHQLKLVNFTIAEIQAELTLKQVHFQGNKRYLKSFGFSLVDIDRARLCLSELKIRDTQQPQEQFIGAIVSSYYNESLSLAFGALGGMNIIGNPKEFFMEVRTGVGQYNSGIIRGTGGLLRGVTAGAANAVSKIMGSLGNGIGSLSLDDKYLTERESIKQRQINGFMDGLSSSGMSIYKGIQCGITGLVRQPYQGMKEDGFIGALKGSLKGLAGLFTKPLTGLIDATSKTAEGLTVMSSLNKQVRSLEEWYRPLYFLRSIIRPYDEVDEMCCLFMRKFLPEQLDKQQLVKCFLLESEDPATFVEILIIGLRQVLQVEIKSKKIQLRLSASSLRATAKFSEGVVLYYDCQGEEQQIILRLKRSNDLKNLLYFTLQKLIETSKECE